MLLPRSLESLSDSSFGWSDHWCWLKGSASQGSGHISVNFFRVPAAHAALLLASSFQYPARHLESDWEFSLYFRFHHFPAYWILCRPGSVSFPQPHSILLIRSQCMTLGPSFLRECFTDGLDSPSWSSSLFEMVSRFCSVVAGEGFFSWFCGCCTGYGHFHSCLRCLLIFWYLVSFS